MREDFIDLESKDNNEGMDDTWNQPEETQQQVNVQVHVQTFFL